MSRIEKDVDDATDPRKSLRDRERAVQKLNEKYGARAVTAQLRKAMRR